MCLFRLTLDLLLFLEYTFEAFVCLPAVNYTSIIFTWFAYRTITCIHQSFPHSNVWLLLFLPPQSLWSQLHQRRKLNRLGLICSWQVCIFCFLMTLSWCSCSARWHAGRWKLLLDHTLAPSCSMINQHVLYVFTRELNNNLSDLISKQGCLVFDIPDMSPSPFCLKLENMFALHSSFENF